MKQQYFILEDCDWAVTVFYDTGKNDTDEIMKLLKELGCPKRGLDKSYKNLSSGEYNTGLTYSNPHIKESLVVLGHASSFEEFLNTWQHEVIHLNMHICESYGISPYSEDCAYLAGDIAQKMFPILSHYICRCNYEENQ